MENEFHIFVIKAVKKKMGGEGLGLDGGHRTKNLLKQIKGEEGGGGGGKRKKKENGKKYEQGGGEQKEGGGGGVLQWGGKR